MGNRWLMCLMLILATTTLMAQELPKLTVDIAFPFVAGDKAFPVGKYEFSPNDRGTAVTVRSLQGRGEVVVPVMTRLAPRPGGQASLLFDRVRTDSLLSEMYLPGLDGFMFKGAAGAHSHVTVTPKK